MFRQILTLRTEVEQQILTLGKRAPNARLALNEAQSSGAYQPRRTPPGRCGCGHPSFLRIHAPATYLTSLSITAPHYSQLAGHRG